MTHFVVPFSCPPIQKHFPTYTSALTRSGHCSRMLSSELLNTICKVSIAIHWIQHAHPQSRMFLLVPRLEFSFVVVPLHSSMLAHIHPWHSHLRCATMQVSMCYNAQVPMEITWADRVGSIQGYNHKWEHQHKQLIWTEAEQASSELYNLLLWPHHINGFEVRNCLLLPVYCFGVNGRSSLVVTFS